MGRRRVPLLLSGLALCGALGVAAGVHSLRYDLTVKFQRGFLHPRFLAEGRLDDEPFLHYDSEKGRAEPRGLWAHMALGSDTWDAETKDLAERGKKLSADLSEFNDKQRREGGAGLHSLQETWGCETREDNPPRGFWDFYYKGELFLSYHPEKRSWKVPPSSAQTLAEKVKEQWEEDHTQSRATWAQVRGELCKTLQRHLHSWMDFVNRTVSPDVNVTCSEALNGTVTLTCAASGFYPRNISLAWQKDGEHLSPDAPLSGDVLPYGNGTYQTRVTTSIPQGEEGKFSCHVGHGGSHRTHPAPCGRGLVSRSRSVIAVAAAAVIIFIVFLWKKRKTASSAGGSDLQESQQVLNQQLMAPSNPKGTPEQEWQSPLLLP